jgi:hypothetical protein
MRGMGTALADLEGAAPLAANDNYAWITPAALQSTA